MALVARLALAAARDGVDGWYGGLRRPSPRPATSTCRRCPPCTRSASTSSSTASPSSRRRCRSTPPAHPPGMLLLLDGLGIDTRAGMAALVIGVGALAVPLTYALARIGGDERAAVPRAATLLLAFSPSAAALRRRLGRRDVRDARASPPPACSSASGLPRGSPAPGCSPSRRSSPGRLLAVGAFAAVVVCAARGLRLGARAGLVAAAIVHRGLRRSCTRRTASTRSARSARRATPTISASRTRVPTSTGCSARPVAFLVALGLPDRLVRRSAPWGRRTRWRSALFAVIVVSVVLGLHQGRDRADLAVPGPARCASRRPPLVPAAADAARPRRARRPGARHPAAATIW